MATEPVATFSIVACDLDAGQWGVAVQSKFLAVGSVVQWAEPQVGAIATQAYANPRYGPDGLALLREGRSADEVVATLTSADDGRAERQLGIVDGQGRAATFTGPECHDWAGGRTGSGYAPHQQLFGVTPSKEWLKVEEGLAAELRDRLATLGYDGELARAFSDWAGTENLEERIDGVQRIDPVVLEALRKQSG